MTNNAQASTPTLTWQGVDTLQVLCLVSPAGLPGRHELQSDLCSDVRALAADGAPFPVKTLTFGDPALLEPGTATLLVHGNVQTVGDQQLLVFDVRLFRPARPDAETFFETPPRAIPLTRAEAPGGLSEALAISLADILPWRHNR